MSLGTKVTALPAASATLTSAYRHRLRWRRRQRQRRQRRRRRAACVELKACREKCRNCNFRAKREREEEHIESSRASSKPSASLSSSSSSPRASLPNPVQRGWTNSARLSISLAAFRPQRLRRTSAWTRSSGLWRGRNYWESVSLFLPFTAKFLRIAWVFVLTTIKARSFFTEVSD